MHDSLRKLLVGGLLVGGLTYFALVRDQASPDGLVLFDLRESAAGSEGASASEGVAGAPLELPTTVDAPLPEAPRVVRGRLADVDGAPIALVRVRRAHPYLPPVDARTDDAGNFELSLEVARGELELAESDWILLGGLRHIDPQVADTHLLVAAPRGRVTGRVIDEQGRAVADALVRLIPPADALVPFGIATPPVDLDSWRVWTNAEGTFRFDDAPRMTGVTIDAEQSAVRSSAQAVVFSEGRAAVTLRLSNREN